MATVPRLQRAEPAAMPKNARINMQVQDHSGAILQQTNAVGNLGEKGAEIYQQYEDSKIDTLSAEAELEYTNWNNDQLNKLKNIEGDPTDHYAKYDEESTKKREDILASRPDLNDRVKRNVTARLDKTVGLNKLAAYKQRGAQQETYDNNMFEANVKLKKDNLPQVAGYITKEDPTSTVMFDQGLAEIKTLVAQRGLKTGTVTRLPDDAKEGFNHVYKDADGNDVKVSMSLLAKSRLAKELSDGVKSSVDVLISSGKMDEARMLQSKYKDYIDTKGTAALEKKFSTADRKGQAYQFIGNLRGTGKEATLAEIDKIKDPELKLEVLKIRDTEENRIQNMRERHSKMNYDTLANNVMKRMNSDQPFYGIADLEEDPVFKQTYDRITDPAQKKALIEMVEAPKNSNTASVVKVNDFLLGNSSDDIENMTFETFNSKYLVGLSRTEKASKTKEFMRLKNPSAAQERQTNKRAYSFLKDQLVRTGHIVKNDYGRFDGEDEEKLIDAQGELMDYLSTLKVQPSDNDLRNYAKELAAAKVENRVFKPKAPVATTGQTQAPVAKISSSPEKALEGLTNLQVVNYKSEFMKANGFKTAPSSKDPRFLQYLIKVRKG